MAASALGQLLLGSTKAYQRPDCMAQDSSSTSLPSPSPTAFTVDGVLLTNKARVLYTALTASQEPNNWVYQMVESFSSGSLMYYMTPATDGRNPNSNGAQVISPSGAPLAVGGSAPEALDFLYIEQGSSNGAKLLVYTGSAWTNSVGSTL
jgi:hypothetical protein